MSKRTKEPARAERLAEIATLAESAGAALVCLASAREAVRDEAYPLADPDELALLERAALSARRSAAGALLELEAALALAVGAVDLPPGAPAAAVLARSVRASAEDIADDRAWGQAVDVWGGRVRVEAARAETLLRSA